MFESILGKLPFGKDSMISTILKPAINHYLDGIGTAREVSVDTTRKSGRAVFDMHGEDRPVEVEIQRYAIQADPDGNSRVVLEEFSCPSHPWLTALAKKIDHPIALHLPVPASLATKFF